MAWIIFVSIIVGLIFQSFWAGIIVFIISSLVFGNINKQKQLKPERSSDNLLDNIQGDPQITESDDPEFIEAKKIRELAKRKQGLAKEKKLDDLMVKVYEETRHFPSWIKKGRDHVPLFVEEAVYLEDKKYDGSYRLKIKGNVYEIKQEQSSGLEAETYLTLTLYSDGKKVFEVASSVDYGEWATSYHPFSIGAYKEGIWEEDLADLLVEIEKLDKEREKDRIKDKKELEDLRGNFDIR